MSIKRHYLCTKTSSIFRVWKCPHNVLGKSKNELFILQKYSSMFSLYCLWIQLHQRHIYVIYKRWNRTHQQPYALSQLSATNQVRKPAWRGVVRRIKHPTSLNVSGFNPTSSMLRNCFELKHADQMCIYIVSTTCV